MPGWNAAFVSIEIEAPRDRVWAVLADFSQLPRWSPFLRAVEIDALEVGRPMRLHVQMKADDPRQIVVDECLTTLDPPHRIGWSYRGMPRWMLRTERIQRLEVLEPGRTRYVCEQVFRGPVAPLVVLTQLRKIRAGFERTAQALKDYVEG